MGRGSPSAGGRGDLVGRREGTERSPLGRACACLRVGACSHACAPGLDGDARGRLRPRAVSGRRTRPPEVPGTGPALLPRRGPAPQAGRGRVPRRRPRSRRGPSRAPSPPWTAPPGAPLHAPVGDSQARGGDRSPDGGARGDGPRRRAVRPGGGGAARSNLLRPAPAAVRGDFHQALRGVLIFLFSGQDEKTEAGARVNEELSPDRRRAPAYCILSAAVSGDVRRVSARSGAVRGVNANGRAGRREGGDEEGHRERGGPRPGTPAQRCRAPEAAVLPVLSESNKRHPPQAQRQTARPHTRPGACVA